MYEQQIQAGRDIAAKGHGEQKGDAHVHRSAERLQKRVESLADTVARLEERLGSVMCAEDCGTEAVNSPPIPGSPLAVHLQTMEARLGYAEGSLHAIMGRLDI